MDSLARMSHYHALQIEVFRWDPATTWILILNDIFTHFCCYFTNSFQLQLQKSFCFHKYGVKSIQEPLTNGPWLYFRLFRYKIKQRWNRGMTHATASMCESHEDVNFMIHPIRKECVSIEAVLKQQWKSKLLCIFVNKIW